ncbi:hypothetical protein P3G55_07410 [Leptospira sp. 96542]|nr:hypothetical protein [Leptospira sp. 96542]
MFTAQTFDVDKDHIEIYTVNIMNLKLYWKQPLFWNGVIMFFLTLSVIPLLFLDGRTITGANAWIKPFKFTVSVLLYSFTTIWILIAFVTNGKQNVRIQWALTITSLIEIILIFFQAARGEASHFNISTPLNQIIFSVMGTSISIFWVFHLWILYLILKNKSITNVYKEILGWGLFVSGFGMILGFFMTTPRPEQLEQMKAGVFLLSGGHNFGGSDGGQGITFLGWSTEYGDMRIAHFVGMHCMQIFTAIAAYYHFTGKDNITMGRIRILGFVSFCITLVLTIQALAGKSLFQWHNVYSVSLLVLSFVFVLNLIFILLLKGKTV